MWVHRRWVMTGSVFLLALATGHLMQNADRLQAFFSGNDSSGLAESTFDTGQATAQGQVDPASVVQLSADTAGVAASVDTGLPGPAPVALPAAAGVSLSDRIARLQSAGTALPPAQMSCAATSLSLAPAAGGFVDVVLSAPCDRNADLTVRHGAMELSYRTDGQGSLEVTIPALSPDAVVEVEFPGRDPLIANVSVPEAEGLDRVVLLSRGTLPVSLSVARAGTSGGEIRHFGDVTVPGARLAQVLTVPRGSAPQTRVEAAVTQDDCGRWVHGQTIHVVAGGQAARDFSLAMPGCDAIGDLVALPLRWEPPAATLADAAP